MDTDSDGTAGPAGRMLIARGLRQLQERKQLREGKFTQTQWAKAADVSPGTVNRYVDWQDKAKLTVPTIRSLALACDATEDELAALERLVRTQEDGWWVNHPGLPAWMDPLISFEEYATYEYVFANSLIPGLLQTRRYAAALHQAQEPRAEEDQVERAVEARMQRQSVLDRDDLHLWVVLDEAVLHRFPSEDAGVMAEQLDHLASLQQRRNVDIQVLPFGAGHAAGSGGHYVVLGREDTRDPSDSLGVVYLELHRRGIYLDDPGDVQAYRRMFDYARYRAADPRTSAKLLTKTRTEITR